MRFFPDAVLHCLVDPLTGSNGYVIAKDGEALIIDPNNFPLLQALLISQALCPKYVIITHEHCDHIAGLNQLRAQYSLIVISSKACSDGLQSTTANMTRMMESYLYFKSNGKVLTKYPRFTCAPADITFADSYRFTWAAHQFSLLRIPGHTPGSICIMADKTYLFTGDYFIPGEEVITRLPGGDSAAYERKGKPLLRQLPENTWVYPGHGSSFLLTSKVKTDYGL